MKRISLFLLTGLLINTLAVAQLRNFEQRGSATQEMRADGLTAAHPNLAIGTKVMVVNTLTGKEVEVTINSRMPASASRVVDLSPGAWRELGLSDGVPVRLYLPSTSVERPPETPSQQLIFLQRGGATQEMRADGLTAAHSFLAFGTRVIAVNTLTGKEIEVTINGRISASPVRIVDFSPNAWRELDLAEGIQVLLYFPSAPFASPPGSPPPVVDLPAESGLRNFEQRGGATQEMRDDGLTAAHPVLALGTKVMVVNTLTGKEVEVTITRRIPSSSTRIVDISSDAWRELGLTAGVPVRLYLPPRP